MNYDIIRENIKARKANSYWSRGVKIYALELLQNLEDNKIQPNNPAELLKLCLDGAPNWDAYSWGGCSLICNADIAERLCCPSELKKTRNGERRPNSSEEWLDVQSRALKQAFRILAANIF